MTDCDWGCPPGGRPCSRGIADQTVRRRRASARRGASSPSRPSTGSGGRTIGRRRRRSDGPDRSPERAVAVVGTDRGARHLDGLAGKAGGGAPRPVKVVQPDWIETALPSPDRPAHRLHTRGAAAAADGAALSERWPRRLAGPAGRTDRLVVAARAGTAGRWRVSSSSAFNRAERGPADKFEHPIEARRARTHACRPSKRCTRSATSRASTISKPSGSTSRWASRECAGRWRSAPAGFFARTASSGRCRSPSTC